MVAVFHAATSCGLRIDTDNARPSYRSARAEAALVQPFNDTAFCNAQPTEVDARRYKMRAPSERGLLLFGDPGNWVWAWPVVGHCRVIDARRNTTAPIGDPRCAVGQAALVVDSLLAAGDYRSDRPDPSCRC